MDTPCRIHYLPDDREIEVEGQSILDASLAAGIPFAHACGGKARCSTCRVRVMEGIAHCTPRSPEEVRLARHLRFDCSIRLACQTRVTGSIRLRRLVLDWEDQDLASASAAQPADTSPGEEKALAILFADLAGFTAFSERLPPYDVIHALNRYYHHVGSAIALHRGLISNYAGDGFMALFGLEDPADATLRAIRAGFGILEAVKRLEPYFEALHHQRLAVRIGIHFGTVVVGSLGYRENPQTTVIGDAVNFASRIEAANKKFGTRLLISSAAREQVREQVEVRRCPPITISGKTGRHTLFEITHLPGTPGTR